MGADFPGSFPKHLQALFTSGAIGDAADGQLLERFVENRDELAFEVLVARHGPMVYRVCRAALADSHEAEDAFQAVFLVLARQAASVRSRASIASWLFGVATRVSAHAKSDAARHRKHEQGAAKLRPTTAPELVADRSDPYPALHEELARLPGHYREALILCYLEGQTCDDAARRLGRPVGTVKARLSRARGILKDRLIRRGVALPAGVLAAGVTSEATASVVPKGLSATTVSSALQFAAGASVVSSRVSMLTEGVLKMMFVRRTAIAAILSLSITLAAGTSLIAWTASGPLGQPQAQVGAQVLPPPSVDPVSLALKEALPDATATADPYTMTLALIRLARAQASSGDRDDALATFRLAERVAGTAKNEHLRRLGLMRAAAARGNFGDINSARATLNRIVREAAALQGEARYNLMSMAIEFQVKAGLKADAEQRLKKELAAIEAIPDERIKDGGRRSLVPSQIMLGHYDDALSMAARYTDENSNTRASLIELIMRSYKVMGGEKPSRQVIEQARRLASEITYPVPQGSAITAIAVALTEAGDIPGGLAVAHSIYATSGRPGGIVKVAPAPWEVPLALVEIAREQIKAGAPIEAKNTLREAFEVAQSTDPRDVIRTDRVRTVGEAQAEIGDIEGAKESAEAVEGDNVSKSLVLIAIGSAQAKAGHIPAARSSFHEALAAAAKIGPRGYVVNDNHSASSNEVFRKIAVAQAQAGDSKGAVATVAGYGTDAWKSEVLAAIAPIQARLGDIEGSLATARSIQDLSKAADAYSSIASIQARSGDHSSALAWASRLDNPAARAIARIGVTEGIADRRAEKQQVSEKP